MLSAKSDKPLAEAVCATAPDGPVYEFHTDPLIRYYTVNFYIGDRMRLFAREMPTNGWIIIDEPDIEAWREASTATHTPSPKSHHGTDAAATRAVSPT